MDYNYILTATATQWGKYQNLPRYLKGLRCTLTINDTNGATWDIPACRVYMMRQDSWSAVDTSGWTLLEVNQQYITGYSATMYVYYRDFAAGSYTFDNYSAMYFFDTIGSAGAVRYNTTKMQ